MDARPYILDNRSLDGVHADGLTYLIGDIGPQHPLAIATGYVNLDGLHHLARLADGRPIRLLIGAEPDPGLGAASPLGLLTRTASGCARSATSRASPLPGRPSGSRRWTSGWRDPRCRSVAMWSSSCTARPTSSDRRPTPGPRWSPPPT